jgi:hypothetical protein
MGCGMHRLSSKILSKADIIELKKHGNEFHGKRLQILEWMEESVQSKQRTNDNRKIHRRAMEEMQTCNHWQEAWQREQELVAHPSRISSCESKLLCITTIDGNRRYLCENDVDNVWRDFDMDYDDEYLR